MSARESECEQGDCGRENTLLPVNSTVDPATRLRDTVLEACQGGIL